MLNSYLYLHYIYTSSVTPPLYLHLLNVTFHLHISFTFHFLLYLNYIYTFLFSSSLYWFPTTFTLPLWYTLLLFTLIFTLFPTSYTPFLFTVHLILPLYTFSAYHTSLSTALYCFRRYISSTFYTFIHTSSKYYTFIFA